MASLAWSDNLNPTVEIINIQRNKIAECIKGIEDDVEDHEGSCTHVSGLISQLEQLCQLHFMYEEQLLEQLKYPAVSEQRKVHESFLRDIEPFKVESSQCHTHSFIEEFIKLRLAFVTNMNNETMMLCDFIIGNYLDDASAASAV